jgi:hypothetical protein
MVSMHHLAYISDDIKFISGQMGAFKIYSRILYFLVLSSVISIGSSGQSFQLKGKILDSDTQEPLQGISVSLKETAYGSLSDLAGNFLLEKVTANKYSLSFSAEGYNRYEQIVKFEKDLDLGTIYLVKFGAEGSGAALQKTIRSNNIINLLNARPNFIGGNMVYGIPPEAKKLEGNTYLDLKWNMATILLYRDQQLLEGYRARYNILSNMFELMEPTANQISTMPGLRIQNIVWMDSSYNVPRFFVNGMDFKDEGSPISGFFEVLIDGQMPLMRRTMAVFKESNYNTALMIGNRNDQFIKRNIYYYLEGVDVKEIPTNRKKLFAIFGDKAGFMEEFAESNTLNIREPSSIFQLFTHYNSQFEGFRPIMSQLRDEK